MPRELTEGELQILQLIQTHYGPQNTVEKITWINDNEAVLWVEDRDGTIPGVVHLTNLAQWVADGTIKPEDLYDWLRISDT